MITHDSSLDPEKVLRADLAFHLGSREHYDIYSIRSVCQRYPIGDSDFVCLQKNPPEVFAGSFFKTNCRFSSDKIECDEELMSSKQQRTFRTIKRDYSLMSGDTPYAFALRDRRLHNYKEIFHTKYPIPVFQYHRHKALSAIIHPLRGYHEYPSKNIPRFLDIVPFAEKKPVVFWRGNLAGRIKARAEESPLLGILSDGAIGAEEQLLLLRQSVRYTLSEQSVADDRLDAGIVLPPLRTDLESNPLISSLTKARATITEHFGYRYLLALDGYDGPSSWYWMLNSNSIVIRQKSDWLMFGDNYFVPWVHFIPMAEDASDLMDLFDWCERNQSACEKISLNAKAAWSVLFNPSYQVERRRSLMQAYCEWFR